MRCDGSPVWRTHHHGDDLHGGGRRRGLCPGGCSGRRRVGRPCGKSLGRGPTPCRPCGHAQSSGPHAPCLCEFGSRSRRPRLRHVGGPDVREISSACGRGPGVARDGRLGRLHGARMSQYIYRQATGGGTVRTNRIIPSPPRVCTCWVTAVSTAMLAVLMAGARCPYLEKRTCPRSWPITCSDMQKDVVRSALPPRQLFTGQATRLRRGLMEEMSGLGALKLECATLELFRQIALAQCGLALNRSGCSPSRAGERSLRACRTSSSATCSSSQPLEAWPAGTRTTSQFHSLSFPRRHIWCLPSGFSGKWPSRAALNGVSSR